MTTINEIKLAYNLKKEQNLAKFNGFKFDWNSKTWKHAKGIEMKESHPLYKFAVISNDSKKTTPNDPKKMTYDEAYAKFGMDYAEEGNY